MLLLGRILGADDLCMCLVGMGQAINKRSKPCGRYDDEDAELPIVNFVKRDEVQRRFSQRYVFVQVEVSIAVDICRQ